MPTKKAAAVPVVGAAAPAFTAMSDTGEPLRLASFRGRWVILFFYPKDDTPG